MRSILDPTYSSKPLNAQPRALIDPMGNMHDPDYRHFPLVASYASSNLSTHYNEQEGEEYIDPFSSSKLNLKRSASTNTGSRTVIPYSTSPLTSPLPSPQSSISSASAIGRQYRNHLKRCGGSLASSFETDEGESEVEIDYSSDNEEAPEEEKERLVTCTETLKRRLQSLSLKMSVGAFRARKKLKIALQR